MHRAARYSDNLNKQQLFEQIIFDGLCKLLQAVSDAPESDPEEAPSDPGDRLLDSLQGIVRQAKANGTSGLIQKVKALVASFEQEQRNDKPRPGMRVTFAESETSARNQSAALTPSVERKVQVAGAPQHANARPASQAGPKATEAPKRPAPVIAGKLCPEWCNSKEIRLKDLQSLLNEGSEPSGEFCLATVSKATELVMLAQTHGLTAKCALLIPAHCKDDMDKKLSATHMWVKIVGKGWIKCTAVPLTSSGLPTWPSSPAQVTVGEKDSVDAPVQLTVRITIPKRFVMATLWQDLLKKPNKVLADFLPAGLEVAAALVCVVLAKYKSGKWTALATAPQLYKSQEKLIYTVGNVDMIISLWRKAPRNFHEERLAVSQSWFESSKAPEPDADMETGVVTPTHKEEQIAEKASALSLTLRTKIAACLATGKSFQQTWFADAGATVDTEAGNPATTWQEYIETVKRPHKWADSWMIQAAAVVLKTEVHVFKWCRRMDISPEWIRFWQTEERLLKLAWVSCLFTRNWPCPVCKVVLTAKGSSEKAVNAKLGEMRWAKEQAIEKHRKEQCWITPALLNTQESVDDAWSDAMSMLGLAATLLGPHLDLKRKCFFAAATAIAVVKWGWLVKVPPKKAFAKLEAALRRCAVIHAMGDPSLCKIMRGDTFLVSRPRAHGLTAAWLAMFLTLRKVPICNMSFGHISSVAGRKPPDAYDIQVLTWQTFCRKRILQERWCQHRALFSVFS
ncbi:unnamed protein product [Symbiodinium microadriaticum]|nr:unnamed protein product [Symbiodinium microadriaticum]